MSDLTFNESFSRKLRSTDLGKKFWKNNAQGKIVINTEFLADVLKIQFHPSSAGYILFVDRDDDGIHHVRYFNTPNEEQVQWMMLIGLAYLSLHYGKRNFPFLQLLSKNNKWVSNHKDTDYSSLYRLAVKFFAPIWFTQKMAEKELGDDKVTSSNLEQAWPAYWNYASQFVLPKHVKDEGYLMLHYYYKNLEHSRKYVKAVLRGSQSRKVSNGQLTNCEIGVLTLELASAAITPFLF